MYQFWRLERWIKDSSRKIKYEFPGHLNSGSKLGRNISTLETWTMD